MNKFKAFFSAFIGHKNIQAAFVLAFFLIVFYQDVIFFGKTFLIETAAPGTMPMSKMGPYKYDGVTPGFVANDPGAIAWAKEPINRFLSKSIKSGDFPLWNPYMGLAGGPLLADGYTGPLEPIQFLFFLIPTRFWAYSVDAQLLIRFLLAGFGCFLFAKRLKLDFWGCIAVGTSFMLSGYFITFGNHPQVKTEVLLPFVIYAYDRLVDKEDRAGFWWACLFIGWAIIAAMPESTFFALMLGSLWFFYKSIFVRYEMGFSIAYVKSTLLRYLGSTLIGFLISAIYLLPFLELVVLSEHGHGVGAGGYSLPLWHLPDLIFQVKNVFYMQVGLFAFFVLFYLILSFQNLNRHRKVLIFWGVYAIIMTLVLFDFPLTNWVRHLPVFNQIVLQKYAIPSIVFSLSILIGVFIDSFQKFSPSYKKMALSLFLVLFLMIGVPTLGSPSKTLLQYFTDITAVSSFISFLTAVSLASIFLLYLYSQKDVSVRGMQIFFLVISISGSFNAGKILIRPDRLDPYQVPPFVDYLREDDQPFRIFALNGILYPNVSSAYRISDIRWLNALVSKRAYEFSAKFIESSEVETIRLTGTVLPISDQMFNLLNVKYVLSATPSAAETSACLPEMVPMPYMGVNTLHQQVLDQNPELKMQLLSTPLSINGTVKTTLQAYPSQEFYVKVNLPSEHPSLNFSVGLHPARYLPGEGDGVGFQVALIKDGTLHSLFSKYIDPQNNPCDRVWFNEIMPLDTWKGSEVILAFSTDSGPAGNDSGDWAYWGDIYISSQPDEGMDLEQSKNLPDYQLAYQDRDVQIFENKNVFPRAFVVYSIVNVTDFDSALSALSTTAVNLKESAVVENFPKDLENRISDGVQDMTSTIGVVNQIDSGRFDVKVETISPGLLIVTDQYYPGWQAYVDGELSPIYAVDGIFRGVYLDKGSHTIEFKYQPLSFTVGSILSLVSLLIVLVFLLLNNADKLKGLNKE